MDILPIVITAISVSILWLGYLKFFKNDGSSQNQSELKDKEHEIELIKLGHEKELSVLKEKLNSIEIEKNHLEETLTKERETTKNQLETLGKVDAFKTSVTGNMGRYSEMIEKQQKFIDKLTGNAKYQGNFGEKFLEQSLQFHGFKLNVDYTKQKHEDQNSPYKNLLKPKAGGIGVALSTMPFISTLLDLSISYDSDSKSFWSFLCSEMSDIKIKVRSIEIPEDLLNKDYSKDKQYRDDLKDWLNKIWEEKDRFLSST